MVGGHKNKNASNENKPSLAILNATVMLHALYEAISFVNLARHQSLRAKIYWAEVTCLVVLI